MQLSYDSSDGALNITDINDDLANIKASSISVNSIQSNNGDNINVVDIRNYTTI